MSFHFDPLIILFSGPIRLRDLLHHDALRSHQRGHDPADGGGLAERTFRQAPDLCDRRTSPLHLLLLDHPLHLQGQSRRLSLQPSLNVFEAFIIFVLTHHRFAMLL